VSRATPSCVWRITPELLVALDTRFGDPTDAYVNGSQVWIRDDGPGEVTLEWRLHPVAGFKRPSSTTSFDLLELVVYAIASGAEPPAAPEALWDGLEAFPIDDPDEVEPARLAAAATESLGIAPDAFGLVDHEAIGDRWEATQGGTSVVGELLAQLDQTA
jgi:hypothetical protein